MRRPVFLLLFSLLASTCCAQRIYVEHSGDDLLGKSFAFAFKEAINRSTSYSLADSPEHAIRVTIVTMDPTRYVGGYVNRSVVASVTAVLDAGESCPIGSPVIRQELAVATEEQIENVAKNVLVGIDEAVVRWRRKLRDDPRHVAVNELLAPKKQ